MEKNKCIELIQSLLKRRNRWHTCQLTALLLFLTVPVLVHSQSYSEGKEAYLAGDYARTVEIIRPLAEQGEGEAMALLSLMYEKGEGVPQDPDRAFKWLQRAATQGMPDAQHDLGLRYYEGKGVAKDYIKAGEWWEKAAQSDVLDSQFNLGLMYHRGQGFERDYVRARELLFSAANKGHVRAQYSLAVIYAFGQGVKRNYDQALELFQKAADQGVAQAQYNLGVLYENGYGVSQDQEQAKHWYRLAIAQGVEQAQERLDQLENRLPQSAEAGQMEAGEDAGAAPPAVMEERVVMEQADIQQPDSAPSASPITDAGSLSDMTEWVKRQPSDSYTLQLASSRTEAGARGIINRYSWEEQIVYVKVRIKGDILYNVLYGSYSSVSQAKQQVASLPVVLQKNKPWPRNFSGLLALLAE